jgi:hypothetical protein
MPTPFLKFHSCDGLQEGPSQVQQQRKLTKAIKRARILSLLPFVASNDNNTK